MVLVVCTVLILAFMILVWDKASGLTAEERREAGLLKATGWETSDVLWMKFWEGLALSSTSFMTGVILAYLHVFFHRLPCLSRPS